MNWKIISLLVISSLLSCTKAVDTNPPKDKLDQHFQALLKEAITGSFGNIAGSQMTVIAPDLGIQWTGAEGFDSKAKKDTLGESQVFRIASVTKTFVASAILKLHEQGVINIDDPIHDYISQESISLLKQGGYDPTKILIKHCLNHTSGLFDYAMGDESYSNIVMQNPDKKWTRHEQLNHACEFGKQVGEPGQKYSYSDTGYILLGEIIEYLNQNDLGHSLKTILDYEKIGLEKTWLENVEEPRDTNQMVSRYFRRKDATKWDASIDLFGGGGLISNTEDLANYIDALFNHRIYDAKSTLDLMLTKASFSEPYVHDEKRRHKDYRYGLWEVSLFGTQAYMHGGLWSTAMVHVPEYNCSIAINYVNGSWDRLLKKTVLTIKNLHENQK